MGKKGGKKKGKAKKSGGGGKKGKKSTVGEERMTLQEVIMARKLQESEKEVDDMMYEIKGLQEKNKRHEARNVRLKEEQQIHIQVLLRQAKEQEMKQKDVFTCDHVEEAMKELWMQGRSEEQQVRGLDAKIESTNEEYDGVLKQVEVWTEYRDVGSIHHADEIKLLELELEDMESKFEQISAYLKRQLDAEKSEVKSHMELRMTEQQHLASEEAMEKMDKHGVQEIHENEWLKKEAEIHRKDVASLYKTVEMLESENIQLISELIDCQVEDLKISRKFVNPEFDAEKDDDLMDRQLMSMYEPDYKSPTGTPARAITSGRERPKSALLVAIEDRVFSIKTDSLSEEEEDFDEQEEEEEEIILEQQEYLHLGPLELKLLCVKGEAKPIHSIDSGIQIVDGTSSELTVTRPTWPISAMMLQSVQSSP